METIRIIAIAVAFLADLSFAIYYGIVSAFDYIARHSSIVYHKSQKEDD